MYPLVIILPIALLRKDKNVAYYVLPLSLIGAATAFYQYLLQMTPLKAATLTKCEISNPCSKIDAIYVGFITIPFMSLLAFLVISFMMYLLLKSKK